MSEFRSGSSDVRRGLRFLGIVLLFAASTMGCATIVENRVETELTDAGVPAGMANCMAEIWADDLSVSQIKGIGRFARSVKGDGRKLTPGRLIGHARDWNDPKALAVVTMSAARCAFS